jgi:hypothetical protein
VVRNLFGSHELPRRSIDRFQIGPSARAQALIWAGRPAIHAVLTNGKSIRFQATSWFLASSEEPRVDEDLALLEDWLSRGPDHQMRDDAGE